MRFVIVVKDVESGLELAFNDDDCLYSGVSWNIESDLRDVTPEDSKFGVHEFTGYSRLLLQARFKEGFLPKWTETDKEV